MSVSLCVSALRLTCVTRVCVCVVEVGAVLGTLLMGGSVGSMASGGGVGPHTSAKLANLYPQQGFRAWRLSTMTIGGRRRHG